MDYDWVIFLNDEFHPTFQKELSKQLFEKGVVGTGVENFKNIDFQLIVGLSDLEIKCLNDKIFAKIDFITPGSFSIPIDIFWTIENSANLLEAHKNDISNFKVDINWGNNFPLDEILPYMDEIEPIQ